MCRVEKKEKKLWNSLDGRKSGGNDLKKKSLPNVQYIIRPSIATDTDDGF